MQWKYAEQSYYVTSLLIRRHQDALPAVKCTCLRHAVSLLGIDQAELVLLQNPKRGVVLEGREDAGAGTLLLVEEPNTGRDPNNSHHAEDDQDGQHRAGRWAEQATTSGTYTDKSGVISKSTYSASLSLPLEGKKKSPQSDQRKQVIHELTALPQLKAV